MARFAKILPGGRGGGGNRAAEAAEEAEAGWSPCGRTSEAPIPVFAEFLPEDAKPLSQNI